ncbi:unnamed protein product [Phytomonas sp. EM1]|nr:unnamed protein product [Phytomonas sp. EM1]|eukprot:CCW60878.1 unnamed protein product [Phytomonas sp. isolate EM1]
MRCIMCEKEGARYRCRPCGSAYCSSDCFKTHRAEGEDARLCSVILAMQKKLSPPNDADLAPDLFSDAAAKSGRGKIEKSAATAPEGNTGMKEKEEEEEPGVLYLLKERHLAALANDPDIRRALRSSLLQQMLRTIDQSRSRLDALDAALHNNPDFKHFCEEVINLVALVEEGKLHHKRRRRR